ncbi:MAG: SIMPL domain-containing protein [Pseudomonadota bacterium]
MALSKLCGRNAPSHYLVAMTIALASLAIPAHAEERPAIISFSGTGSVSVVPDEASVSLGVVTQAETAAEALKANTPAVSALIEQLKEAGVADEDLRTERFNLSPVYGRQEGNQRQITGYQVANTLRVRIADLADLGAVLDQAVKVGATSLGGIQMQYGDRDGALDEARKLAFVEAKRKASLMAEAAEAELGRVLSIAEGGAQGPQPYQRTLAVAEASAVPIEAGSEAITATVTVVWQLDEDG